MPDLVAAITERVARMPDWLAAVKERVAAITDKIVCFDQTPRVLKNPRGFVY